MPPNRPFKSGTCTANPLGPRSQSKATLPRARVTAVGVKLRSARLAAHAVVTRTGGAKGSPTAIPAKDLTYEAKLYKANGVIQPAQARGQVYQLMTKAQYTAATRADPGHLQAGAKLRNLAATKVAKSESESGLFGRIFRRRDS